MTKPTLLVTGASGFLGWNLCREAQSTWNVVGVAHAHPVEIPGARIVPVDLTDAGSVGALVADTNPSAAIHAAAMAQPDDCQQRPQDSRRINVDAAVTLAQLCADQGIPFAFTSTDLVFDGRHPPYREEDPPSPVSVYGDHKVTAEKEILGRHPGALICRMPLMFGDPGPAAKSFVQPMIAAMRDGREIRLFVDEVRTPAGGTSAARGILRMLREGVRGTVHLGGRQRISRYDFGRILAGLLGVDARIVPSRQCDVRTPAPRPPDVSLDSSKAFALGYDPLPIEEELRAVIGRG